MQHRHHGSFSNLFDSLMNKTNLRRVVAVLACIVVFVSTYAMILPAIALEKENAAQEDGIYLAEKIPEDAQVTAEEKPVSEEKEPAEETPTEPEEGKASEENAFPEDTSGEGTSEEIAESVRDESAEPPTEASEDKSGEAPAESSGKTEAASAEETEQKVEEEGTSAESEEKLSEDSVEVIEEADQPENTDEAEETAEPEEIAEPEETEETTESEEFTEGKLELKKDGRRVVLSYEADAQIPSDALVELTEVKEDEIDQDAVLEALELSDEEEAAEASYFAVRIYRYNEDGEQEDIHAAAPVTCTFEYENDDLRLEEEESAHIVKVLEKEDVQDDQDMQTAEELDADVTVEEGIVRKIEFDLEEPEEDELAALGLVIVRPVQEDVEDTEAEEQNEEALNEDGKEDLEAASDKAEKTAEEKVTEEEQASEEKEDAAAEFEPAAGKTEVKENNYTISVSFDKEAGLPEQTQLSVTEIGNGSEDYSDYYDRIREYVGENATIEYAQFYDLTLTADEKEIQPKGNVDVSMKYRMPDGVPAGADRLIVHFTNKGVEVKDYSEAKAAEEKKGLLSGAKRLLKKGANAASNFVTGKTGSVETVTFKTDGFSAYGVVYTVDFHYEADGKTYDFSMPGGEKIYLSELVEVLGIYEGMKFADSSEFVQAVEKVEFSDESLVKITKIEGDWELKSLVPFTSDETLTIIMKNGDVVTVKVTDQNSDIANYIIDASISGNSSGAGVTVDGDSWRLDDPQGNYNISLNFSESGLSKQFPTIASGDTSLVLTYKLPNGLKVDAQSGSTLFADATTGKSFNLPWTMDTNGNISFVIDDQTVLYTDPDGTQWTAYDIYNGVPNARININFTGSWDGTTNEINFGNNVIKDVHASSDKTGEFNLEKSSALENNRIKYTITAESNFPVSEAKLTDTMTAQNGITIDQSSLQVTGSNVNYWTTSFDQSGKLTASLKMPEGHTTSKGDKTWFVYYADIDYASLDTDKDGKVTLNVDNTVSDDGGDTKTNNFTNTISYSNVTKGTGEAGTVYEENGEKYRDVTWTIKLNDSKLADMSGTTLTDWIEKNNDVSMEYSGQGLTIKATDTNGTETTSQVDWTDSSITKGTNSNGEPTWTYTFPSDAGKKAYEIRYTTKVKVTELQDETYINNKVKSTYGEGGSQGKIPGTAEVNATKTLTETSDTEDTWEIVLDIPAGGLSNAWLTENLPKDEYNGKTYYDSLISYEVIGAVQGDYWKETSSGNWGFTLNFYKDEACTQSGLQGTGQSRQIRVRVKTRVNQDWFDDPLFTTAHTNNVNFNNHKSEATATHKKSSIQKTLGKVETHNDFLVNGVKYRTLPYTVTFQNPTEGIIFTDKLNIDGAIFVTAENKQTYRPYNDIYDVRAGDKSWDANRVTDYISKVKVTGNGNAVTFDLSDAMAKNGDDEYYRYYIFEYYVVVPVEALQNMAKTSGQGYVDVKNTATWGEHSSSSDYKVPYEHLDKRMINEGSIGGDNRAAQFEIKSNPEGIRINNGSPYKLTDTFSDNLSLDYNSIKCDPESALISYTVSQNTIAFWLQDGVAATLTYEGKVVGEGQLNIKNTAETEYSKKEYSTTKTFNAEAYSGGSSPTLKVLKIDENNALIRLPDVKFVLDYDQESSEGHGHIKDTDGHAEIPEAQRTFTTNDKGIAEITGGRNWTLYFDTDYQLTEVQSSTPEGYRINEKVYKFRIDSDGKVDWSKHQYYNDYVMQIKNTPKQGKLSVSKTVTNGNTSDQSKTFDVKVTFYNDEAMTKIANEMTGSYGDVDVVKGVGTFVIKHSETVTIDTIPEGKYYRVEETSTGNYTTTYNGKVSNDGATGHIIDRADEKVIINNDIIPKGSIMVQKTWNPEPTEDITLTINLYRRKKGELGNAELLDPNVVLSKSNNWTGGWESSTFINTDEYEYFIRESNEQIDGYTGTYKQGDTILQDWSVKGNDDKPVVKIDATQDPVIINIHNEIEPTEFLFSKEWRDYSDQVDSTWKEDVSITVGVQRKIGQDGQAETVGTYTITKKADSFKITKSQGAPDLVHDSAFTFKLENLPSYGSIGEGSNKVSGIYIYYATETETVQGYRTGIYMNPSAQSTSETPWIKGDYVTTGGKIINKPEDGVELPMTGGPGTRMYTILGMTLIAGAGVLLLRRLGLR